MKKYFFIFFSFINVISSVCQELHFERKINLPFYIENISIDSENQLYLSTKNGNLFKYSSTGDSLYSYSPARSGEITLIEAYTGLKVFLFFIDFQGYVLLDRFLRSSPVYFINKEEVEYASLATPGSDGNLWLLDPADFALKKYNIRTNQVEISSPLSQIVPLRDYEITHIREYQNSLFIFDAGSGVYLFDNMGNYQKQLPLKDPIQGFLGNEMYFLADNKVYLVDIYSGKRRNIQLPEIPSFQAIAVRVSTQRVYVFERQDILIYKADELR